eukprot:g25127.t1
MIEVIRAMRPWHLALIANGFARLNTSDERFFAILASEICRKIGEFEGKSLALAKIGDYVCSHASELYPRALASFLFSFSEVDIRHGVLFYNAPDHVTENIKAYTTDELCMVGRAYGHFQMVHTLLFDSISTALPSHVLAEVEERQAGGLGRAAIHLSCRTP